MITLPPASYKKVRQQHQHSVKCDYLQIYTHTYIKCELNKTYAMTEKNVQLKIGNRWNRLTKTNKQQGGGKICTCMCGIYNISRFQNTRTSVWSLAFLLNILWSLGPVFE